MGDIFEGKGQPIAHVLGSDDIKLFWAAEKEKVGKRGGGGGTYGHASTHGYTCADKHTNKKQNTIHRQKVVPDVLADTVFKTGFDKELGKRGEREAHYLDPVMMLLIMMKMMITLRIVLLMLMLMMLMLVMIVR